MIEDLTRELSSAVFGNEKFIEVVLALDARAPQTAQGIGLGLSVASPMVRSVLKRLEKAGVARALPRATTRAPLYFEPIKDSSSWRALASLCRQLLATETLF